MCGRPHRAEHLLEKRDASAQAQLPVLAVLDHVSPCTVSAPCTAHRLPSRPRRAQLGDAVVARDARMSRSRLTRPPMRAWQARDAAASVPLRASAACSSGRRARRPPSRPDRARAAIGRDPLRDRSRLTRAAQTRRCPPWAGSKESSCVNAWARCESSISSVCRCICRSGGCASSQRASSAPAAQGPRRRVPRSPANVGRRCSAW